MGFLLNPPSIASDEEAIKEINLGTKWGEGENKAMFAPGIEGSREFIKHGSNASPVTAPKPTAKVVRTENITVAAIEEKGGAGTDGSDQVAVIMGLSVGNDPNQIQSVGVYGGAINQSNAEGVANPDASGGYFIGRISGGTSAKATAIGATIIGRREVTTADVSGAEISARNQTATPAVYAEAGASGTRALWVYCSGESEGGCLVNVGNPVNVKAQVGIGFPKQNGGAASQSTFRDDGEAIRSLDVRGAHTYALRTNAPAAGAVVIGHETLETANALLEVANDSAGRDPIAVFGSVSATQKYTIMVRNSAGSIRPFVAGTGNDFFTGTVAGDSGLEFTAGKGFWLGAVGKEPKLRVTEGGLSFYGVAPVARHAAIAEPSELPASLKAAINGLRDALTKVGITE